MVKSTGTHIEVFHIDSVCSGFTKVSKIPLGELCQWDQAKESLWMQPMWRHWSFHARHLSFPCRNHQVDYFEQEKAVGICRLSCMNFIGLYITAGVNSILYNCFMHLSTYWLVPSTSTLKVRWSTYRLISVHGENTLECISISLSSLQTSLQKTFVKCD